MKDNADATGLKDTLLREMERYFGDDARRIDHAHRVTAYATELLPHEGGDEIVVTAAAVLHDIGIPNADRKYGSSSGKYQEIEGPPVAREILAGLGFQNAVINEVCEIIGHHHRPGHVNTQNFKILYDADWLVNLGDEYNVRDATKLSRIIDRVFLTARGRVRAGEIYLGGASP